MAKAILTPKPDGDDFFFPARGKGTPFNGHSPCKRKLDQRCGVSEWTLHDLRRTFASGLASIGGQLPVIERLLNHVSGSFGGTVGVFRFAVQRSASSSTGISRCPDGRQFRTPVFPLGAFRGWSHFSHGHSHSCARSNYDNLAAADRLQHFLPLDLFAAGLLSTAYIVMPVFCHQKRSRKRRYLF
jgi:hypothetical protein